MGSLMVQVSSFSSFWKLPVTSCYALGVMSGACVWISVVSNPIMCLKVNIYAFLGEEGGEGLPHTCVYL